MNSLKNRWEETGQKFYDLFILLYTLDLQLMNSRVVIYCPCTGWRNSFTWKGNQWIKAFNLNYPTVLSVIQVVIENACQF